VVSDGPDQAKVLAATRKCIKEPSGHILFRVIKFSREFMLNVLASIDLTLP
jgi:hypothetical protein